MRSARLSDWASREIKKTTGLGNVLATEFCEGFVELMRRAMVVSFYKYGKVAEGFPAHVNALDSLEDRLRLYKDTGNAAYLADVANFAMIEFMHPSVAKAHYDPDNESPGRVHKGTSQVSEDDNDHIGGRTPSRLKEFL